MKRMIKMTAVLLFVALAFGVLPVSAAGTLKRPRHVAPAPPDILDIAWAQIVTQAQEFFPVLRIVNPAPHWPDQEQPMWLVRERPRKPAIVAPDADRDLARARLR